jgi:hypothetical protein
MTSYSFQLHISPDQYLDYYRGVVKNVIVRATTGQTVQFPARMLQRFVSPEGIHGNFTLQCDDNNKCVELKRLYS